MKKLIVILCLIAFQVRADVRLPAIIGDHMVLQQQSKIKLWGWSNASEPVTITTSWDNASYTASTSGDARWMAMIQTPVAGGPYQVTIKGYNQIVINDVMIGEVWIMSGQSNMEWSGSNKLPQALEEMPNATNKDIRFFHIPRITSESPQDNLDAKWIVCNPEDMKKFSAIGYFFGKKINEITHFPMGLINASWGGTPAEVWTPAEVIDNDPALAASAGKLKANSGWPVKTALAYNAMIYPITNYQIAGVLWYQGESNVGTNETYASLFSKLISSWRQAWGAAFPFYFVQIAPFDYGTDNINGALLREQQTHVSIMLPQTGMVVSSDLVDDIKDIHPIKKKEVAMRLANIALAETYRQAGVAWKSPTFKSMVIEKDKARISFNDANNGLMSKGDKLTGFYLAGEDGRFLPANARIDKNNSVLVWNKDIKQPVAVRFGFTNTDTPNLFSKEGLPVNLFRTDISNQ